MLLKCSSSERRCIPSKGKGKLIRSGNTGMRMTTMSTGPTMTPRIHRKVLRIPSKRHPGKAIPSKLHTIPSKLHTIPSKLHTIPSKLHTIPSKLHTMQRLGPGKMVPGKRLPIRQDPPPCDNSNDSGLGIDQSEMSSGRSQNTPPRLTAQSTRTVQRMPYRRPAAVTVPPQSSSVSRNGNYNLQILAQPEQQHRARYQTEGSRGAVKDRSGNGFPIVKLTGYNKSAVLQVFIGTDIGRVAPHMFYQACKVSGKNSTPCNEKKLDGTMLIEIDFKPENDMTVTCDCVGILKERNVDVEHRFPDQSGQRSKKKSTRCRMVFRTQLLHDDDTVETLQVCSQPIVCTQPPGIPEICKKSLKSCPSSGGLELFIIGKNFLKDTRVLFQERKPMTPDQSEISSYDILWEENIVPDKEFLQQNHLVCVCPPYASTDIDEPVQVKLMISSGGKLSESHDFEYFPKEEYNAIAMSTSMSSSLNCSGHQDVHYTTEEPSSMLWSSHMEPKCEMDTGMMPPPSSLPLNVRRSSSGAMLSETMSSPLGGLKTEIIDENSQGSIAEAMAQDTLDRFVAANANDNSMDADMVQYNHMRKRSIDMISQGALIVPKNAMELNILRENAHLNSFSSHNIGMLMDTSGRTMKEVEMCVKEENMRQRYNEQMQMAQDERVNTFLNQMEQSMEQSRLKNPVDTVTAAALYASSSNNADDVMMSSPLQTQLNQNSNQGLVQQYDTSSILTEEATRTINEMLSLTQSPDSQSSHSPMSSNHSPLSQDIILNSQRAATLSTNNGMNMVPSGNSSGQNDHNMTSDIILNPTVSPTLMCPNADANNMLNNTVTLGATTFSMQSHDTQGNLINTIIQPIMQSQQPESQMHQCMPAKRTTPVAVKNLILNAAAEILSSQSSTISAAETTINALMSLNEPQSQMHLQMEQSPSTTSQQQAMFGNSGVQMMPNNTQSILNNIHMNNLVQTQFDQEVANSEMRQAEQLVHRLAPQMSVPTNVSQESLLQAVSLVAKNKAAIESSSGMTVQQSTPTTIPQELTAMSDHDLISYINPSCFDQGEMWNIV